MSSTASSAAKDARFSPTIHKIRMQKKAICPFRRISAVLLVRLGPQARERRVDAVQRFLAPERRQRLEDPRRDRGPGDRDPNRLVDLAGLGPKLRRSRGERGLYGSDVESRRLGGAAQGRLPR